MDGQQHLKLMKNVPDGYVVDLMGSGGAVGSYPKFLLVPCHAAVLASSVITALVNIRPASPEEGLERSLGAPRAFVIERKSYLEHALEQRLPVRAGATSPSGCHRSLNSSILHCK